MGGAGDAQTRAPHLALNQVGPANNLLTGSLATEKVKKKNYRFPDEFKTWRKVGSFVHFNCVI